MNISHVVVLRSGRTQNSSIPDSFSDRFELISGFQIPTFRKVLSEQRSVTSIDPSIVRAIHNFDFRIKTKKFFRRHPPKRDDIKAGTTIVDDDLDRDRFDDPINPLDLRLIMLGKSRSGRAVTVLPINNQGRGFLLCIGSQHKDTIIV